MFHYTGNHTYDTILLLSLVAAVIVFPISWLPYPTYGKFSPAHDKFSLRSKIGWIIIELPAPLVFGYFFLHGKNWDHPVPLLIGTIFILHYVNRGFISPLLMHSTKNNNSSAFSLLTIAAGFFLNFIHGYLNGFYISEYANYLTINWLWSWQFIIGIIIYVAGVCINISSDRILRSLRDNSNERYSIPYGGFYRWVSCPNYLGEIILWLGFTIFTWQLGGLFILILSLANLIPRAIRTDQWYRDTFPDYPKERKAIIPFIK